jgi:hypothetical protein
VILLLMITLILIPIALAAAMIFGLGVLFGWIAIGTLLGERLAVLFKAQWAPAVHAGVGTFALSLGAALFGAIPCVGWVVPFLIMLVATGGIVMSAFGTRTIKKSSFGPSVTVVNPGPGPAGSPPAPASPIVDTTFVEPVESQPSIDDEVPPIPEKRSVLKNRKIKSNDNPAQEEK